MPVQSTRPKPPHSPLLSSNMQLVAGFVVPTIILLSLSDESRLGPLWAMALALIPPILLELYSLRIRRKPSFISIIAIAGILFIGAVSFFGLSEEWLAARRSIVYVVVAIGLVAVVHFKQGVIDKALAHIIAMDTVREAAKRKGLLPQVARHIRITSYACAVFLLLIGIANYVVTLIFITAPTGTSEFNAEYARLRVLSILFVTVPSLIGGVGLFMYLMSGFEKMTGITTEGLLKQKK